MTESDDAPSPAPEEGSRRTWTTFVSMGLTLAACVAGGLLLGIWLDSLLHTSPLCLFGGLILGCGVAVLALVSMVKRSL